MRKTYNFQSQNMKNLKNMKYVHLNICGVKLKNGSIQYVMKNESHVLLIHYFLYSFAYLDFIKHRILEISIELKPL